MQLSGLAALSNSVSRRLARQSHIAEDEDEGFGAGNVYKFNYPNYNLDPKPRVLVLGFYDHPKTGNTLLGGLNLNYMTTDEVAQVKKALPGILQAGNLKARYWAGRQLLPAIFKSYYRTYDRGQATPVKPAELEPQMAGKGADSGQPTRDTQKEPPPTGRLRDLQRPQPDRPPTTGPDRVEKIRQALNRPEPTPEPESAEQPEPRPEELIAKTPPAIGTGKDANREKMLQKAAAYQKDRDKLKGDLRDRLVNKIKDKVADKEVKKLEKQPAGPAEPLDKQDKVTKNPAQQAVVAAVKKAQKQKKAAKKPALRGGIGNEPIYDDDDALGLSGGNYGGNEDSSDPGGNAIGSMGTDPSTKKLKKEGYTKHPILGLLWESRAAYRRLHGPSAFLTNKKLVEDTARARYGCRLLAVVNARTGETLLDRTIDHSQIIDEAGWNYQEVVRLLPIRNQGTTRIHVMHDGLNQELVKRVLRRVPRVAVEALRKG